MRIACNLSQKKGYHRIANVLWALAVLSTMQPESNDGLSFCTKLKVVQLHDVTRTRDVYFVLGACIFATPLLITRLMCVSCRLLQECTSLSLSVATLSGTSKDYMRYTCPDQWVFAPVAGAFCM